MGLERDSSAVAVVAEHHELVELLEFDEVRPAKGAPLTPSYVIRDRFAPVMKRHDVSSISMDAHYRQSAKEHLDAVGLSFEDAPPGNQGKYDSYMLVRAILREGKLRIPLSPRLVAQMKAVSSKPMPGGWTKITSPRRAGGGHGDVVSALVLAVWAVRSGGGNMVAAMTALAASGGSFFGLSLGTRASAPERTRVDCAVEGGRWVAIGKGPGSGPNDRAEWPFNTNFERGYEHPGASPAFVAALERQAARWNHWDDEPYEVEES